MKKEENLREDLQDLNIDEEFLAMTPKACPIKEKKMDKLDFAELHTFAI